LKVDPPDASTEKVQKAVASFELPDSLDGTFFARFDASLERLRLTDEKRVEVFKVLFSRLLKVFENNEHRLQFILGVEGYLKQYKR